VNPNRGPKRAGLRQQHPPVKSLPSEDAITIAEPLQCSNVVVRDVRDKEGNKLGTITEPYDGTEQSARSAAERISNSMFEQYPDASNIESRIGATDASGKPKWTISPNFRHIAEIGTDQARYIWGEIGAAPVKESPAIKAFKEKGYVLNPKTGAWEKPQSS